MGKGATLLAVLALLNAGVVHAKTDSSSPASNETVGIRLGFDPATLDWNLGDVPIHVINNVVEGLYGVDASGKVVPNEATRLPSREGNIYRITLRKGLRWSDGKPVTAADYVTSWKRLLDPATGSTYASLLFDLKGARAFNSGKEKTWSAARALGELELELEVEAGVSSFSPSVLTHWATFPLRAELVARHGKEWAIPPNAVYNGPYRISEFKHDVRLTLVPNTNHRSPGQLKRIDALIVADDSTALQLFEAGRLHFVGDLGSLDRGALKSRSEYHVQPSPILVYVGVGMQNASVANAETRGALSQAIDRSTIPVILGAEHQVTTFPVPKALRTDGKIEKPISGSKGPLPPELVLGYFERGTNRTLVEYLQNQWKRAGSSVEVRASEVKSYWGKLKQSPPPLFLNTYGPPVWDQRFYFELLTTTNPMNMGRWSNPAYDAAVANRDWKQASRILVEELPVLPLYFRAYDYLASPRLKGFVVNPMTSLFLSNATLAH